MKDYLIPFYNTALALKGILTSEAGEALLSFVNEKLFPSLKNLPIDANTPRAKSIVQETFGDLLDGFQGFLFGALGRLETGN